jgi:hypothetical protein
MKAYWGSGCRIPRILNLRTRWMWVVSFTPRSGERARYPLDSRLGGPQSRYGHSGGNICSLCRESNLDHPSHSQSLYRLSYLGSSYEGRLQSSWTHLITSSQNFVEVRWRSLFRSTSLGKRCSSYNAPPTSRKRAADRWSLRIFLPRSSLFVVGKAQKSHEARSELYGGCSNGVPLIHFFQAEHRIQFRSRIMRFLGFSNHERGAPRQEISKWSTVCSMFSRSWWSVVRSASLPKGGTWKKRPTPHLHKVPIRGNKSKNFANCSRVNHKKHKWNEDNFGGWKCYTQKTKTA